MDTNTHTITETTELVVAEVTAYPDEVRVEINSEDGVLTVEQARDLAAAIVIAQEDAQYLYWDGEGDDLSIADRRES